MHPRGIKSAPPFGRCTPLKWEFAPSLGVLSKYAPKYKKEDAFWHPLFWYAGRIDSNDLNRNMQMSPFQQGNSYNPVGKIQRFLQILYIRVLIMQKESTKVLSFFITKALPFPAHSRPAGQWGRFRCAGFPTASVSGWMHRHRGYQQQRSNR